MTPPPNNPFKIINSLDFINYIKYNDVIFDYFVTS